MLGGLDLDVELAGRRGSSVAMQYHANASKPMMRVYVRMYNMCKMLHSHPR